MHSASILRGTTIRLPMDRTTARQIVLAAQVLILLFAFVTSIDCPKYLDPQHLWVSVWLSLFVIFSQVIYRATGSRPVNWLSIDLFALLTIWLVHFYHAASWLLGWVSSGDEVWLRYVNASEAVCYGTRVSLVGLTAFAIGFNSLRDRYPVPIKPQSVDVDALRKWYLVGVLMLAGGLSAGGILVFTLGAESFEGQYTGTSVYQTYGQSLLSALVRALIFSGSALSVIAAYQLKRRFIPGILASATIFTYLAAMIIAGDRDAAYWVVMIVGVAYTEFVRPLKFRWLIAMLVFASLAMGVAFIARNSPRRDPMSMMETVAQNAEHIQWDHGFIEAGGSAMTLYAATKYVPEYHDYYYGKMQITRLSGIVPFGGNIVGMLAAGYIDPLERDSATALTYYLTKSTPGYRQFGAGSTCVADIYMDFGVVGVLILHFLVGMLSKFLLQKSRSSGSIIWMAGYLLLLPAVGYASRGSLTADLLRNVWWNVAFILVVAFVLGISTRISIPAIRPDTKHTGPFRLRRQSPICRNTFLWR
jgi:oligosaccharide repeat unit polymerase